MKPDYDKCYVTALQRLIQDKDELYVVKVEALNELTYLNNAYLIQANLPSVDRILPPVIVKDMLDLAYMSILKKLGADEPNTTRLFKQAIKTMSDAEAELEWEAIVDGTVSRVLDTMMNFDKQDESVQQDIQNIFEGLAKPYFSKYKGNVPKEDLKWAHDQIRDYFKDLEKKKLFEGKDPLLLES